ncbi:MAG: hypothetical protein NC218_09565 [Acetobacter sp.]|nr:hypothetical protein [Acetobacter sp.]
MAVLGLGRYVAGYEKPVARLKLYLQFSKNFGIIFIEKVIKEIEDYGKA